MNPKVDVYLSKAKKWQQELERLRAIILDCHLTEVFKWGKPCYTFQEHNVVAMLPLKEHCALLVFKGALLNDPHAILVLPGENTQSARQIRFTSLQEIIDKQTILKSTLREAIEVEKAGLSVNFKPITEHAVPEELQKRLDETPTLKAAFRALTPGHQRAYLIYFSAPKQSKTRETRIDKYIPQILSGKGLNDQ